MFRNPWQAFCRPQVVAAVDVEAEFDELAEEALLAPAQAVFEPVEHPALHPGRSASLSIDGQRIGVVGQLHPRWRQAYELTQTPVLFELDLDALLRRPVPAFAGVSRLQPVERDIAVIVSEAVTHEQLMAQVHSAQTQGLLRSAT
ncbi:MAG: phenylalanine--tRNA ligase subunit beta, partial [Betaproteobacteria bacterium]|nr:phenylalanine--tRNA ligase subunit beta [Betaproteobacteria bacterium]